MTGEQIARILKALETIMQFDGDVTLRAEARRRYIELTEKKP